MKIQIISLNYAPYCCASYAYTELANGVEGCGLDIEPEKEDKSDSWIRQLMQESERNRSFSSAAREKAMTKWRKTIVLNGLFAAIDFCKISGNSAQVYQTHGLMK